MNWLCVAALAALACAASASAATVVVYPAPAGEKASEDYTIDAGGKPVFVYTAQVLRGGPASFAYFDFDGPVDVTVTARADVAKAKVRPESAGIAPKVEGRKITFTLARPGNLTLELGDSIDRALHLFANPLETDTPKPDDPNVLYFGPGVHEVGTTVVPSGKTVYLAGGSIVRGKILPDEKPTGESFAKKKCYTPLFSFKDARQVAFRGRGILDMSTLDWHSKNPICVEGCTDVRIEGVIIKDAPNWCYAVFGSKNVLVRNVKAIAHRENSDGIDIVNSQDVVVDGCFLRTNDDEICVKTTSPAPALEGKNITFQNCVIWNERAQGLGITYETRVNVTNFLVKNCDVIHDFGIASLAIYMVDSGTMSGVRFEDCRLEDTKNKLIYLKISQDMWAHDATRGHVSGVQFKNIAVTGGPFPPSEIAGFDADHLVENVSIEGLTIHGTPIEDAAQGKFSINAFTKGIRFGKP